jgi:hypothetical protein
MNGWTWGQLAAILVGWYLAQTYAKHPENIWHVVIAAAVVTGGCALIGWACYSAGYAAGAGS